MLDQMTPEWAAIANSIAVFVELKREKGEDKPISYIDEYNAWLHWSGYEVRDPYLAEWCTSFLKAVHETPSSLNIAALKFDGIPISSMKPVPER